VMYGYCEPGEFTEVSPDFIVETVSALRSLLL
jgi:hypothetical protein